MIDDSTVRVTVKAPVAPYPVLLSRQLRCGTPCDPAGREISLGDPVILPPRPRCINCGYHGKSDKPMNLVSGEPPMCGLCRTLREHERLKKEA